MFSLWGFFMAVALISAIAMIGLILLQQGKGADMGASFGAGASGSLFGATGSANPLSKATAWSAAIFFACTLALTYIDYHGGLRQTSTSSDSVFSAAAQQSAAAAANPSTAASAAMGTTSAPLVAASAAAPSAAPTKKSP